MAEFRSLRTLGEGGYGVVELVRHDIFGDVARKTVLISTITGDEDSNRIRREVEIHQNLRHPNIVIVYDVQFTPARCNLYLEYMKYGTVEEVLRQYETELEFKLQIVHEVSMAMAYLHNRDPPIIHGDLTCGNILVGYEYHAKVSDFGFARIREISRSRTNSRIGGTLRYIAPEYLSNPHRARTKLIDVYGFGISVWEIFSEKRAYYDIPVRGIIPNSITAGTRPNLEDMRHMGNHRSIKDLIEQCWDGNVEARPSFDRINKSRIASQLEQNQRELTPPRFRAHEQRHSSGDSDVSNSIIPQVEASVDHHYHPSDIRLLKKFTLYEERVETTPGPIDASNRIMVAGIACLENKIYIACCPSNRIIVISGKEPFDRILDEEFEVAGLTNAQDMVACKLTRSLFISDATPSNRTTKIRPKTAESLSTIQFRQSGMDQLTNEQPHSLSTSFSGNLLVLVTVHGLRLRDYLYIYEFTLDSHKLTRLLIPINIKPTHAVQDSRGKTIIGYVDNQNSGTSYIGELSADGTIVRKFDIDLMESTIPWTPWSVTYLMFDRCNNLFIIDAALSRIFLLNPNWSECEIMIKSTSRNRSQSAFDDMLKLDIPSRLCHIAIPDRLVVAQWFEKFEYNESNTAQVNNFSSSVSIFDLRAPAS